MYEGVQREIEALRSQLIATKQQLDDQVAEKEEKIKALEQQVSSLRPRGKPNPVPAANVPGPTLPLPISHPATDTHAAQNGAVDASTQRNNGHANVGAGEVHHADPLASGIMHGGPVHRGNEAAPGDNHRADPRGNVAGRWRRTGAVDDGQQEQQQQQQQEHQQQVGGQETDQDRLGRGAKRRARVAKKRGSLSMLEEHLGLEHHESEGAAYENAH